MKIKEEVANSVRRGRLMEVLKFANLCHANQQYGNQPYQVHLIDVCQLAQDNGYGAHIQEACLLHDVLEDTACEFELIEEKFGFRVANIVLAVKDEDGDSRKIRKALTYPKIKANPDAVIVKILDRVSNVNSCIENGVDDKLQMYQNEQEDMFLGCFNPNHPKQTLKAWELFGELFDFNQTDTFKNAMKSVEKKMQ